MKKLNIQSASIILFIVFFLLSSRGFTQQYKLWGNLKQGDYGVGFEIINKYDYSRPIIPKLNSDGEIRSKNRGRPIQISIWYPAEKGDKPQISFDEYIYNVATELDFDRVLDNKAKEESLDSFKRFLMGYLFKPDAPDDKMRELIKTKTTAMKNAKAVKGKFPLIILGQGNMDSPHRHAILAEYLASHGYIIATMPSSARISNNDDIVEAQARDFEFVQNFMYDYPNVDINKVSLFGFSLGGNSGGLVLVRNSEIDAFLCFDCGLGSTWGTPRIKQMPEFRSSVNRKTSILNIYEFDEQRTDHSVIEAFKYSDSYFFEMNNLHHFNFTTAGIFAAYLPEMVASSRWLVSGKKAKTAHEVVLTYALQFFNGYFKNDRAAISYLRNSIDGNGLSNDIIKKVKEVKALDQIVPTEPEFVQMIKKKGLDYAIDYYNKAKKLNPDLVLFKENTLNQMGYNEFLSAGKKGEAIKIFKLMVEAYPGSANAYDSLGEAYMQNGDKELAIKNYKKSLELNPQNSNAEQQLKILASNN